MKTSKRQISLFTEDELTSSPEDFHASRTARQVNDLERKMTATSGQKCLERFEKLPRAGLWAKMFVELLIGMEGWYSMRCRLTWRLKGTKCGRMYFQLQVSELPTKDIESGLLPSVTATDAQDRPLREMTKKSMERGFKKGANLMHIAKNKELQEIYGMLPTPAAQEPGWKHRKPVDKDGNHPEHPNQRFYDKETGRLMQKGLQNLANMEMLPTPKTTDANSNHGGARVGENGGWYREESERGANLSEVAKLLPTPRVTTNNGMGVVTQNDKSRLEDRITTAHGKTSQLNPRFVAEMMGFPPNWTELPFQNGEQKA